MSVHFPAQHRWASRLAHLAVVIVVLALAAATFVLSYTGVHSIALQAGVPTDEARIYPGIFDAAFVIACAATLMLREGRWWARAYAWLSIILVIAVVGGADAAHAMNVALPHRETAGAVAAAPWVLVLLSFSLWLTMLRQSRAQHTGQPLQPAGTPQPTGTPQSAAEPAVLEPGVRRPAALELPTHPSAAPSAALEPAAPQPTVPQPTMPQPTSPQPTAPWPTAFELPRPKAIPAEPAAAEPAATAAEPAATEPAAALPIPEDTRADEETPVSSEATVPKETTASKEAITPKETATLQETTASEEAAPAEVATQNEPTVQSEPTAAAERESAPPPETPAEEAVQTPEPVGEARGETSHDEGQPLPEQAAAEDETADGPSAPSHDYWDSDNADEPESQPGTAPPMTRGRRAPAALDEEEPPLPFAAVPRLRRVRSTPTPPEDNDEDQ